MSTIALFGRINEFKPKTEAQSTYIEQLQKFFEGNDIADGKKVAMLLSLMGATTDRLLRNLVQPNK